MRQIPVCGHLIHIRLIDGQLKLMKIDDIRNLSLGETIDLPEYLL